jgi:zinc transport system substrate-binding protein
MYKKLLILLIGALFFINFTGCNKENSNNISSQPAKSKNKELLIMTSFYPVYISTINITKDVPNVQVINLTKPLTGCLHDYQLTVEDMKNLSLADIFVVNGADMESFLDKVTKSRDGLKIVQASENIELIKNNNSYNPHVWVSVSNVIKQVDNIQSGLSKHDPLHKDLYKKNAETYIKKLDKLKTDMHNGLKDIKNPNIITFHEAFPYFAKEFNLNIMAVIEREPGSEPNASELAGTIGLVKKEKVKAIFAEPQYPSNSANIIAKETGIKVFTLDPAVTGPIEENAYIDIMEKNLKVLQEALK